jgi:hypothetical protein
MSAVNMRTTNKWAGYQLFNLRDFLGELGVENMYLTEKSTPEDLEFYFHETARLHSPRISLTFFKNYGLQTHFGEGSSLPFRIDKILFGLGQKLNQDQQENAEQPTKKTEL